MGKVANTLIEQITLAKVLFRGEEEIKNISLRLPDSSSFRGIALTDILRMEVDSLAELVPRLCKITENEFRSLHPYDQMQLAKALTGFLVKPPVS